jgi:membrane fusion protein, heavy metal efflux system
MRRFTCWRTTRGAAVSAALLALLAGCGKGPAGRSGEAGASETAEAAGKASAPEGRVVLSADELAAAGLETRPAGPAHLALRLRLSATAARNLDACVHVNPKAPGVVRAVHVRLGDAVAAGQPLCEIHSIDLGNAVADFLEARAVAQAAERTLAQARALSARRLGIQEKVLDATIAGARTIYEREKDLQERELATLRPYLEAEKELRQAEAEKERSLAALAAERDGRLLELEVALRTAGVARQNAENRLHIFGLTNAEIEALEDEQGPLLGRYVVVAPSAGIVTARDATLNEFAGTETQLFRIDDLSRAWIEASVYEQDLTAVALGQEARVTLDAFPGHAFTGSVAYIAHQVDERTRAAQVRVEVANDPIPEWSERVPIRPGMFATVDLSVATIDAAVAVPLDALVRDGVRQIVFVRTGARVFEARPVVVGRRDRAAVEIVGGLQPGEAVAVAGTFVLKSLLRREMLGGEED